MKLSILVTTMPSRAAALARLIDALGFTNCPPRVMAMQKGTLTRLVNLAASAEMVVYETARYDGHDPALTFGAKRNVLLANAQGQFSAFFDDDDEPHPEYVKRVVDAIDDRTDVVGFKVACYGYAQRNGAFDRTIMEPADVSIRYDGWYNDRNGFKYVRCPHHLAPTRTGLARRIGYKEMHHGEDHEYAMRMHEAGLLRNEAYIDEFLYIYRFDAAKTMDQ